MLPLFRLLRGWSWKTVRGRGIAIVFTAGMLIPFAAMAAGLSFAPRTGAAEQNPAAESLAETAIPDSVA